MLIQSLGFCFRHGEEITSYPWIASAVCPLVHSLACLHLFTVFSGIIWSHVSGLAVLPGVLHFTTLAFSSHVWFRFKTKSSLLQIFSLFGPFLSAFCLSLFTPRSVFLKAAAQQQPAADTVRGDLFDQIWAGAGSALHLSTVSPHASIFSQGYYLD